MNEKSEPKFAFHSALSDSAVGGFGAVCNGTNQRYFDLGHKLPAPKLFKKKEGMWLGSGFEIVGRSGGVSDGRLASSFWLALSDDELVRLALSDGKLLRDLLGDDKGFSGEDVGDDLMVGAEFSFAEKGWKRVRKMVARKRMNWRAEWEEKTGLELLAGDGLVERYFNAEMLDYYVREMHERGVEIALEPSLSGKGFTGASGVVGGGALGVVFGGAKGGAKGAPVGTQGSGSGGVSGGALTEVHDVFEVVFPLRVPVMPSGVMNAVNRKIGQAILGQVKYEFGRVVKEVKVTKFSARLGVFVVRWLRSFGRQDLPCDLAPGKPVVWKKVDRWFYDQVRRFCNELGLKQVGLRGGQAPLAVGAEIKFTKRLSAGVIGGLSLVKPVGDLWRAWQRPWLPGGEGKTQGRPRGRRRISTTA